MTTQLTSEKFDKITNKLNELGYTCIDSIFEDLLISYKNCDGYDYEEILVQLLYDWLSLREELVIDELPKGWWMDLQPFYTHKDFQHVFDIIHNEQHERGYDDGYNQGCMDTEKDLDDSYQRGYDEGYEMGTIAARDDITF